MSQNTRLPPPYTFDEDGRLYLYVGPLKVTSNGTTQVLQGRVYLDVIGTPKLAAEINVEDVVMATDLALDDKDLVMALPGNADLTPPLHGDVPSSGGSMHEKSIDQLVGGDLTNAICISGHILGTITDQPLPVVQTSSGPQGQLAFQLGYWNVRLARIGGGRLRDGAVAFTFEADKSEQPTEESVDRLISDLFVLLSFVANVELGIGPVVALDDSGRVIWAKFGAPRIRAGSGVVRWCPSHLVPEALPQLADGLTALDRASAMARVVDRSVQYLLVAPGPEVLDVMALSGWARGHLLGSTRFSPDTAGSPLETRSLSLAIATSPRLVTSSTLTSLSGSKARPRRASK